MRKIILILVLLWPIVLKGADTKLTGLDELTAIAGTDILYIVDDPSGSPLSKKITAINIFDLIDTFSELNTIVANKTLVNEEDAVTWDALGTFGLGITITTGDPFTFGTTRWDNGSDLIDGEQIAADTIDNDSIDWSDMTDLTTDGALSADVVEEDHIADNGIDSEHYNDGSIDAVHLAADVIDETKIADDGIDSEHYNDGSIDLVHLAAGVYAKDLVTTAPVTGAADNIFVGADADVTIALDFTAAWDFSGTTTIIPWKVNATAAPTVEGQAIWESDTDELTVGDGSVSVVIAAKTNTVFCFNVHDIDSGMDDIKMPFTRATTITKVTAFVTAGTNVVGRLYEVDGDGDDADAVGVESSDWTFTAGETEDTSFNNATFDAGDYIQWDTTSVSGSVTGFMISVEGYEI